MMQSAKPDLTRETMTSGEHDLPLKESGKRAEIRRSAVKDLRTVKMRGFCAPREKMAQDTSA